MYCKKCGKELDQDDKFCQFCGTMISSAQPNKEQNEFVNSDNIPKKTTSFRITKRTVLKIISIASVLIYFLPIGVNRDWLFLILNREEPTAVSVPIFTLSLILLVALISNIIKNRDAYKISAIIGALNILLSIFLIIPTPFKTQYDCLGSYIVLLVNLSMFIFSFSVLHKYYQVKPAPKKDKLDYTGNAKFLKTTIKHRTILKFIALIGIIAFFLPCALTSCNATTTSPENGKIETGLNVMSHFDSGVGNAYVISMFVLFIVIFISLFIKHKSFVAFTFLLGTVNTIMLLMTKAVFYENIIQYLIGSYVMLFAAIFLSVFGYIYYHKFLNFEEENVITKNTKK